MSKKKRVRAQYSSRLNPLEFRIFRVLSGILSLRGARVLMACSGGVDSIVCLEVLRRLQNRLKIEIAVVYVHHGLDGDVHVNKARQQALNRVKLAAKSSAFEFHVLERAQNLSPLKSEAELREFRHGELKKFASELGFDYVCLAHHADDLLETRMIRLIRGTGAQGLEAMRLERNGMLRPLLNESRMNLRAYAVENKLKWLEDPTNENNEPLRNWLRNVWFPLLEEKRKGSLAAIARSFAQISDQILDLSLKIDHSNNQKQLIKKGQNGYYAHRDEFASLSAKEKAIQIAGFLHFLGMRDFSSTQVNEVVKRLGSRSSKRFHLLALDWCINAGQITITQHEDSSKV